MTTSVAGYTDSAGPGHALGNLQGLSLAAHLRSAEHRVWYIPEPEAEHARLHALMDAHAAAAFAEAVPMTAVSDPREFLRLSGPLSGLDDMLAESPGLLRPSYRTWSKSKGQFYGAIGAPHTHNVYWRAGVLRANPKAARADAALALAALLEKR